MLVNIIVIIISVLLNSIAQLMLKKAMMIIGSLSVSVKFLIDLFTNIYFLGGMLCYGVSIFLWLFILSRISVSIAQPFLSIGFIFTIIVAYYLFNEPITFFKILGVIFICIGIVILSLSK